MNAFPLICLAHKITKVLADRSLYSYICEISPTRIRGVLTTGPQLLITMGLVVGFFTCYGTARIESSFSWRTPFLILASLAGTFSVITWLFLVPSPRWLKLHGREEEADAAWELLGVSPAEREKVEIEEDREASREDGVETIAVAPKGDDKPAGKKLFDIFSKDVWTRTAIAAFLMGMQQLSGIDGVLYVSSPTHEHQLFRYAKLIMTVVCPVTVRTGRTILCRRQLLRFRRLCDRDLRHHHPRSDMGG